PDTTPSPARACGLRSSPHLLSRAKDHRAWSATAMAMATQASAATRHLITAAWSPSAKPRPATLGMPSARGPAPLCAAAPDTPAPAAPPAEPAPAGFVPPQLDPSTPSPIFGGSTGGLLRKAQVEEFYVITWTSPKEQVFEMPTGGAAIMREGPNLLKLARKEQCLALGNRLRSKYKIAYQFYRVFPNGEVQYLHPKDGVYPEKVNAGRQGVGQNFRSIGKNVSPIEVKFTGKNSFDI
uniref:Photosystem I reaction center subunit II, chloroplastic n=6 Tax=Triticinae TaxID=1648030 RepID=A0A453M600_AEGTS